MNNQMTLATSNLNVNDLQSRSWLQTIIDSSHLITFCISISVIIYGSFRSLTIDKENDSYTKQQQFTKEKRERKKSKNKILLSELTSGEFNRGEADKGSMNEDVNNFDVEDNDELDELELDANGHDDMHEHQSTQNIDSTQALFIPIAASISLLLMFFFFDSIQTAFVICTSVLATVAFSFLLSPVCKILLKYCLAKLKFSNLLINKKFSCCFMGKFTLAEMIAFMLSSLLVCSWIVTGHWLLMDLIGVGFCVTFIAIVRLPSLKVSTLLLCGLVIYDVLWVYFSHLIFSSNVMIKVATKEADNPMNVIARKLNMETQFSKDSPKLSLPGKLVVPSYQRAGNFSILGLGDIVVPGLLLCFVLRFDAYKKNQRKDFKLTPKTTRVLPNPLILLQSCTFKQQYYTNDEEEQDLITSNSNQEFIYQEQPRKVNQNNSNNVTSKSYYFCCNCLNGGECCLNCQANQIENGSSYSLKNNLTYFHCSLLGYFVGLITATLSSEIFKEAQPALLYLVPFTLLPLLTMAYLKGDLSLMWNEPFTTSQSNSNTSNSSSSGKYFNVV